MSFTLFPSPSPLPDHDGGYIILVEEPVQATVYHAPRDFFLYQDVPRPHIGSWIDYESKRDSGTELIHLLNQKVLPEQITDMLEVYSSMIKIAVDIRRRILAGGGEMHADCEKVLLENGGEQDDIWGANWYPDEQRIEFEALINIRPRLSNRGMVIQSEEIRKVVSEVTFAFLGGVR